MLRKTAKGNKSIAVIASLCVSILLTVSVYATGDYSIGITDDGEALLSKFITRQKVVDLLENTNNSVKKDIPFTNIEHFAVGKTKKVTVIDNMNSAEIYTDASTVQDLLDEGLINFTSEFDFLNVAPDTIITNGLEVEVIHVTSDNYSITFEIPFETIEQEDPTILKGTTRIITPGKNGLAKNDVEVLYHNGIEFKKNVTQTVLEEKVDKVVAIGTKEFFPSDVKENNDNKNKVPTRRGNKNAPSNLGKPIKFSATAYCSCAKCCGKSTGITASGKKAEYGVVAVDTSVIPLGTKLYIENADGSFTYGEAVAADTGGAIKGNKVDLYFPTHDEALAYGRKAVNVYVVE